MAVMWGRLDEAGDAPATGERVHEVARVRGVVVEQILSGVLAAPVYFDQSYDEWVVVLSGGAVLEVGDEPRNLEAGDWVFLPAATPHRLIETLPGTNWLAIRGGHDDRVGG